MTLSYAIKYYRESAQDSYLESMLTCDEKDMSTINELLRIAKEKEQTSKWLAELSVYKSLETQNRILKMPCRLRDTIDVIFSREENITLKESNMYIWCGIANNIPEEYLNKKFVKVHGSKDKQNTLCIEICDN